MPTSAREAILDQLVANLRTIGSSGSYSATVIPTVTRTRHPAVALPELPFIYLGCEAEDYERTGQIGAAGTYDRVMHVAIQYVFTSPNLDEDASRAVHDVEYALRDWRVGSTASDLEFKSYAVGAQDIQAPNVLVTFLVDIHYRTDDNAPGTRV